MKKYILLGTAIATLFTACDYNDKFDGLDELEKPTNRVDLPHIITDANIATIVKALNANKNANDSAMAKTLNADKMFSAQAPANILIPYLLKDAYYSVDVKSTVAVTYPYKEGRDSIVSALSTEGYELTDSDYKSVWGDAYVSAFTPAKSPASNIPTILASKFGSVKKGTFKNVEYYYSSEEPEVSIVESDFLAEDFEDHEAGTGVLVDIDGWLNKDLSGSIAWQCRSYSGNNYVQVSANNSKSVNDVWLITKAIDLAGATSPEFSFDVTVGYYNATCMSVLISENFDGTEANITSATWKDVTSSFSIPEGPASGYGTLSPAGTLDLSSYIGKKIYIAFRYEGDDTSDVKKTTTYQLDNLKVSEEVTGVAVKEKALMYAAYQYDGSKWIPASSSIVSIQPEDYTQMGLTYLTTDNAPIYLSNYLRLKYPFALDGDTKIVVYKTSKTAYYADECVYNKKDNEWVINSYVVENVGQFVLSTSGWVFDPTIIETLQQGKADTDGYMMVVNYVKVHQAVDNPALVSSYGDGEYYYGFSANYGNVSYREKDRSYDPVYTALTTVEERVKLMNQRTIEGIAIYLSLKYPNATPLVAGIEQFAEITVVIYSDPSSDVLNVNWTYTMQCVGDKEWVFVQRETASGTVEKAEFTKE